MLCQKAGIADFSDFALIAPSRRVPRAPKASSLRSQSPAISLGPALVDHSQKMTVAARAMAEKKGAGHRSKRVVTRRQSFKRPNMISMRLRHL